MIKYLYIIVLYATILGCKKQDQLASNNNNPNPDFPIKIFGSITMENSADTIYVNDLKLTITNQNLAILAMKFSFLLLIIPPIMTMLLYINGLYGMGQITIQNMVNKYNFTIL
jgi:hypothetical protein